MPPRPLPEAAMRRTPLASLLGLAVLAALLWAGRAELPEHLARWFGDGRARIAVDYTRLAPGLEPAGLARLLGLAPLQCHAAEDTRICEAPLAEADGLPAARLRALWRQAQLQSVEIDLPWWAHHAAVQRLSERLGPPARANPADTGRDPRIAWDLAQGTLQIPRAPGWNPWRWRTLRWTAQRV